MRVAAPVLVRDATAADAVAVGEVHAEAWRVAYRDLFEGAWLNKLVEQRRTQWVARMAEPDFARVTLLVAEQESAVVGFAYLGPSGERDGQGELYGLYSRPAVWGTGVAQALMDGAWEVLSSSGYPRVRLWTIAGGAHRAHRFYRKVGFTESGSTRERDFGDKRPVLQLEYARTVPGHARHHHTR